MEIKPGKKKTRSRKGWYHEKSRKLCNLVCLSLWENMSVILCEDKTTPTLKQCVKIKWNSLCKMLNTKTEIQ